MSYTIVHLPVSKQTYDEIHKLLTEASYEHTFLEDGSIDMSGIALIEIKEQ